MNNPLGPQRVRPKADPFTELLIETAADEIRRLRARVPEHTWRERALRAEADARELRLAQSELLDLIHLPSGI